MGKCFLGLGFGALMSLTSFVYTFRQYGARWVNCLLDSLEWLFIGVLLTACAMCGYALYLVCEHVKERRK